MKTVGTNTIQLFRIISLETMAEEELQLNNRIRQMSQ